MDELHDINHYKKIQARQEDEKRIDEEKKRQKLQEVRAFQEEVRPLLLQFFQTIEQLGYGPARGKEHTEHYLGTIIVSPGLCLYTPPVYHDTGEFIRNGWPATNVDISRSKLISELNHRLDEIVSGKGPFDKDKPYLAPPPQGLLKRLIIWLFK